jgi:hypothetical protein
MKDGESVQLGLFALLRESARRDPAQAAQMLAAMPAGTRRTAALTGYVTGLAQVDARQALEITLKETEDFTRQELLRAIFRRAGTYGLARTRELLACLDNPEQRLEQTISALGMLGQEGREDLFPFVQEETARLVAAGGWKSDFDGWANTLWWAARPGQERAFAEWALHFPEGEDRPMLGTVLNRWGRYDAAGCLAWLGANANALDGAAMKRTLNSLRMIGATDPNALRAWAETLPPGTLRDYARFQVAVGTRGEEDVAPALAAYPSVASVDTTGTLATQLARVLVAQDGETSARWAQSLPAGKARTEALSTVASYWSQQDPHGMARWLDQQPPGPERDLLLKGFAAASSVLDTRGAAEWVEQIDDVAQRTEAAQRVYHRWKIENPIAARQWLRQLGGVDATEIRQTLRHGR